MVQVAKEAISTKGPKVTMDVTMPGRYLVFTPFQTYVGISKHIAEPEERQRLEKIVDRLVATHLGGKGLVVRTEAEGASEEELEREVKYLLAAWEQVQKKFDSTPPPTLLHQDLSLALQIARDLMSEQVYVYMVDNKDVQKEVLDFVEGFAPELKERVRLYESKTPIFKAFNIERDRPYPQDQGPAAQRRLDRDPGGGVAVRDRREHRPLHRLQVPGGDGHADEHRGGAHGRAADPSAQHRRHHRRGLHRHAQGVQPAEGDGGLRRGVPRRPRQDPHPADHASGPHRDDPRAQAYVDGEPS